MDPGGIEWYFSGMDTPAQIPVFGLFGETSAFPDVVHCERILDRAGLHDWVISPHRHRQMSQVFHVERGRARVLVDDSALVLGSGQYLYVPPQVVHGFEFSRGTEGVVLSVPSPVVARLGPDSAELSAWLAVPQHGRASETVADLVAGLAAAYGSSGRFRAQRLVAQTHVLLAALAEEGMAQSRDARQADHQMQALDALIAAHLADGWSARDYAGALHVTTGHLNRIVRGATGGSLTDYLETAVMVEACRLIAFTRLPVGEVGYRLGYGDPSYFSRRFRSRMGQTPSAYRARAAGGEGQRPVAAG